MKRRDFLATVAAAALQLPAPSRVEIRQGEGSHKRALARTELLRGLRQLGMADGGAGGTRLRVDFSVQASGSSAEDYSIRSRNGVLELQAGSEQALLYAVFDFLERQGAVFGIDGESYPVDPPGQLILPGENDPWTGTPRFAVRGLLPWPDFLNCITVYNEEDFRAYFESMLRMRFNTFGMHVYTGANQWAESYLSFEFAGVGHLGFLDTTATHRWGYLPERTSRFGMGAADLYAGEVFGSDATRLARDPWEAAERTRALLRAAFAHAGRLGIRTGVGFEPYQLPDEILRALPPEARPDRKGRGPRFDIESVTARDLLETRLAQLLEAYPNVDYVWLWEDEGMNWESRKSNEPLSVTPFLQAHDFLRRHAPAKRLVLSGWGGVARHFDSFHKRLPGEVIFACLSDSLGWDPVDEAFGRLEGRERWPIPWLEDDPAMWLPQFHVNRFESDMNRAEEFGCRGLLGIHWRHRIVDPTAVFQARFSWDKSLTPDSWYQAYARTQAAGARSEGLAKILAAADRDRKLLSTFTGEYKDGHAVTREFSGDYNEAFQYWNDYDPDPRIVSSQKDVAEALRALARDAASSPEAERLEYLTRQVEFLVPYAESWRLAHAIHQALRTAADLKAGGKAEDAAAAVRSRAVPLWLELAPRVRDAVLHFQRIVSTRNDLGTLASMHNKFVRLALVRLRLSIKEYLGTLPDEVNRAFASAKSPDAEAPARLFVPTRPTLLRPGERVRVTIVSTGTGTVSLQTRSAGATAWTSVVARRVARKTWEATLGPFPAGIPLAEYRAAAGDLVTPSVMVTLA